MYQDNRKNLDIYLVRSVLSGDDEAFTQLIDSYKNPIYHFIYRKIPIKGDVEDLAQEVFIKAYKSLRKFDQKHNFSTWLFTIATNHCIDYLRKKRLHAVSLDVPLFPSIDGKEVRLEIPDDEFAPEEVYQRTTDQEEILQAIDSLSDEHSLVIKLRHLKGYSYEEIGQLLDLPLGTIKSRIYRARQELKNLLFREKGGDEVGMSGRL